MQATIGRFSSRCVNCSTSNGSRRIRNELSIDDNLTGDNKVQVSGMMSQLKLRTLFSSVALLCSLWVASAFAQETSDGGEPRATEAVVAEASTPQEFKSLDQDVQSLKKEVLDLNRELFTLEEELLFPANTQVAVFVSVDVGVFFALDTLTIQLDGKEVANYLYTEREAEALLKGGVQRVYVGNLKVGNHELVAFFTGKGPNVRDYKRGTSLQFEKGVGAKYLELKVSDRRSKEQPEFLVTEWE